ncbi:MAG: SDR family NAD(P)-dependent oxidoreductase [Terriglobia bacterium]
MQIRLDDQVAIVTGGSRGIGAATVKLLAHAGAQVVFSYQKDVKAARDVAKAASCGGNSVLAVRAHAARTKDAKKLVDAALRHFGRMDILVANAGIWNPERLPIDQITEKQWDEMLAINLKGVYAIIHHAVPVMRRQKSGRIIAISSTAGQRGESFHTHYGASKGGIISLVKGLCTELAQDNILVNCVAPGWVDTDMCVPVTRERKELEKVNSGIPLRRLARPEEVAMPILFLASEMSTYITGEVLNVNGGNVLCG